MRGHLHTFLLPQAQKVTFGYSRQERVKIRFDEGQSTIMGTSGRGVKRPNMLAGGGDHQSMSIAAGGAATSNENKPSTRTKRDKKKRKKDKHGNNNKDGSGKINTDSKLET